MSDILQILVSSSRLTVDKRSQDADILSLLKDNDVIEAKVLKLFSDRSAQLSLAGRSVTVKTHTPLKEGEVVRLRVVSSGDQHVLKIVPTEEPEPVQQVNTPMAENLERAGPYRNLLKFFALVKSVSTPLKTAPVSLPEIPLKHTVSPFVSQRLSPSPPQLSTAPSFSPSQKEIVGMLDNFLSALQTQIPAKENRVLETFLHTKVMTPQEKLAVLLPASERKMVHMKMDIHQEKDVVRVLEKMVSPSPVGSKTPVVEVDQEKPVRVEQFVRPSMRHQSTLSASQPETPTVDEKLRPVERQALHHVVNTPFLKWPQKVLAVIATNKETFLPTTKPVPREVARVITFLMDSVAQAEKTKGVETVETQLTAMGRLPDVDMTMAAPEKSVLPKSVHILENLLRSIALKSDTPDPKFLPTLIQKGGMAWENKLAALIVEPKTAFPKRVNEMAKHDLKGAVLSFLSTMDQGDEEINHALRNFVDTLEQLQVINRVSSEESGRYLLPFPAFFDHAFQFGQLLVDVGKDASGKQPLTDRVVKVAFILELSALGDLRADFSIYRKSVTGTFGVGSKTMQAVLKKEIPRLLSRLESLGFNVQGIDCQVLDPEELAHATLTNQVIRKDAEGVLNLII